MHETFFKSANRAKTGRNFEQSLGDGGLEALLINRHDDATKQSVVLQADFLVHLQLDVNISTPAT